MESTFQSFETTIGPSVKVEGDLITAENIKIDGIVSGKVHTDSDLTIGPAATIEASVEAGNATVSGKIQGNVKIAEFLHLTESARIYGDVEAKMVQIDKGAFFSGNCKMPTPESAASISSESSSSDEPEA